MKKLIFTVFILSIILSCAKPRENEGISFKNNRKKLNKTWVVDKFYINGGDSTKHFKDNWFDKIYFEKKKQNETEANFKLYRNNIEIWSSYYEISYLDIVFPLPFSVSPPVIDDELLFPIYNDRSWRIAKLTEDELFFGEDKDGILSIRLEFIVQK